MTSKVALVTGAGAGIGAMCARFLAKDGFAVGVLDLNGESAKQIADEINAAGGKAVALTADVSDRAQVQATLAELRGAFGPVTALVNNAGMTGFVPFEELTDEQWDTMLRVNLKSAFIVTQEVLPDMKAAEWGRIVNISSSSAQTGAAGMAHYSSSKGGMIALTRTLAQELGKYGVTCNTVPPRFVMGTLMSEKSAKEGKMPIPVETMAQSAPVRRAGKPEDIASAVLWLCSDGAGYVTGQVIGVNGGLFIG